MPRTIAVRPLRDGVDQRSSWKVTVNGARRSTHTKKSAAKRKAREMAKAGDLIEIYGTNGQHQETYRYEGSTGGGTRSGGGVPTETAVWDVEDIQDDYDDLTDLL